MTDTHKNCIHPKSVIEDCGRFRKLWGLRSSDPDELQEIFSNLTAAWMMAGSTRKHPEATEKELESMDFVFRGIQSEWPIRFSYMVLHKTGLKTFPD